MANLTLSTQNPDDAILYFGDLIGNSIAAQVHQMSDLKWFRFGKVPLTDDSRRSCSLGGFWLDSPIVGTICGSIIVDNRIYIALGFDEQEAADKFEMNENTRRVVL